MNDDAKSLRDLIMRAVRAGPLADAVSEVQIEPGLDDDNEEFLRIALLVRWPEKNVDAELEALLERIEEAVASVDDRYPSVRFLDAA